jgi:hypothetical protein
MKLTSKLMRLWGLTAAIALTAVAQTTSSSGTNANQSNVATVSGSFGGFIASAGPVGVAPKQAVTGLPYSAEQVSERVQTLADGTHIQQTSWKAMLYRDSEGRTRTERTIMPPPGAVSASGPSTIEITDPVAGYRYVLDPRQRTVRRSPWPPAMHRVNNSAPAATTSRAVISFDPPPPAPTAAVSGTPAPRPHPQMSHEALGTQLMEGVAAEGTRMTRTYPQGSVGNDRPITTVSETWTSPELKIMILSKLSDPRQGDSTTMLINLSRTEPDPCCFRFPLTTLSLTSSRPQLFGSRSVNRPV